MINKQNLWFVTLFSLILILGIYYVSMVDNNETLAAISNSIKNEEVASAEVSDSDILAALRVNEDEEVLARMEELQTILLDETSTLEEKNDAYESLQVLNSSKGKTAEIEKLIKDEFKLNSFVKISEDKINITVSSKENDVVLANNIIVKVQSLFTEHKYITVKFQK